MYPYLERNLWEVSHQIFDIIGNRYVNLNGVIIQIENNNIIIISNQPNIKYSNTFIYTDGQRGTNEEFAEFLWFTRLPASNIINMVTKLNAITHDFDELVNSTNNVECGDLFNSVIKDTYKKPNNNCNRQPIFKNVQVQNAIQMIQRLQITNKNLFNNCHDDRCSRIIHHIMNINILHTTWPVYTVMTQHFTFGGRTSRPKYTRKHTTFKQRGNQLTQTRKKHIVSTKKKRNTPQRKQIKDT